MRIPRELGWKDWTILAALTLAVGFAAAWRLSVGARERQDDEVATLRTNLLGARADAQGWRTRAVEGREGLERRLMASKDTTGLLREDKAALAQEVVALGGQIRVLVDMYAEARGQIEAHATEHRVSATADADSVTAPIDDGLLEGRVAYLPPTQRFNLDYVVRLAMVLGMVDAPDGRLLLTARGTDPRVELRYGDVFYQPPAPLRVCSVGEQLRAGGFGAGVGSVITGLAVLLSGR